MKVLKEGEEEAAQTAAIWGGVQGGAIAAVGALALGFLAHRQSAVFRNISVPGKAFVGSSIIVAGTMIGGERALKNFEHRLYHATPAKTTDPDQQADDAIPARPFVHYLATHRYYLIAGVWATSMVGALAISFSQPHLKFSQKLIHARLYAQFGAVAALLATAALSSLDEPKAIANTAGVAVAKTLPMAHKY